MHARRFALLTFVSFAFAGVAVAKDAGNATDAINPHSPRYGHPYRHGVHPTRETHEKMRAWEAANRGVVRPADAEHKERGSVGATEPAIAAAATGPETLSFGGGVDSIGVTSGAPRCTWCFGVRNGARRERTPTATRHSRATRATLRPIFRPGSRVWAPMASFGRA